MIEFPTKKSFYITREQVIEILTETEKQGGNRACAARINRIFESITKESEM